MTANRRNKLIEYSETLSRNLIEQWVKGDKKVVVKNLLLCAPRIAMLHFATYVLEDSEREEFYSIIKEILLED